MSKRMTGLGTRSNVVGLLAMAVLFWGAAPPPDSPVADAAMRADVEAVRELLRQGADVNAAQGDGMTALHWAAENSLAELAEMLIYAGANVQAVTRVGNYTPLHLASKAGAVGVVRALLEAGADPEVETTNGSTALHFAAGAGDAAAIKVLLDHGADVNAVEARFDQTPLMFAAAYGRLDAVEVLLARGADPALTSAVMDVPARREKDEVSEELRDERMEALRELEERAEIAALGDSAAAEAAAAQAAEEEAAREREAARQRQEEDSEEEEEEEGPEPLSYEDLVGTKGGLTPLLYAVRQGHTEVALSLLDAGADINQVSTGDHTSPLLMAMINGHFDLGLELLERGADPNLASDAGAAPLYAVINVQWAPKALYPQPTAQRQQQATYLETMKALLEAGADPNARLTKHLWYMSYNFDLLDVDTKGATPFWRAAYGTDVDAMKLLVSYGADPTIATEKPPQRRRRRRGGDDGGPDPSGLPPVPIGGPGIYPIHAASGVGYGEGYAANAHRHAPNGWIPSVKYLIEVHGADVNARDLNGYTPLHHAAARGDNALIYYLIEQGADVTAVSRRGQTATDMANSPVQRLSPMPETIELLESLGAINNHNCTVC